MKGPPEMLRENVKCHEKMVEGSKILDINQWDPKGPCDVAWLEMPK